MPGTIKSEVKESHLKNFPEELEVIKIFLPDFDITWATNRKSYNTKLSLYFLKPLPHLKDLFGFETEIALIINKYSNAEPRTLQASEQILTDSPAKGRVDSTIYLIYSKTKESKDFILSHVRMSQFERIPVVICQDDISEYKGNDWLIRNILIKQIYSINLFSNMLPVKSDLFFFGRDNLLTDFINGIKFSENRGLFGLRKTGKTSLVFKLIRMISKENKFTVIYIDCKNPEIRNLHWEELIEYITFKISSILSINNIFDNARPIVRFTNLLNEIQKT